MYLGLSCGKEYLKGEGDMSNNIKDFFKADQGSNPAFINRVCNEVMRNGINDMDSLCRILKNEHELLLQMRNIGTKSMEVIAAICSVYTNEREKTR